MKGPPVDRSLHRRLFGQHFLRDVKVCESIVENFIKKAPSESQWIEIGPGTGALTHFLLLQKHPLILLEKDRDLVKLWQTRSLNQGENKIVDQIIEADAVTFDYAKLLSTPTSIISNLPYAVGTAILLALFRYTSSIQHMTLMFQKEVAERLLAEPGQKNYGSLSITIQNLWKVERVLLVKPSAFKPPPKVDSLVVSLTPHAQPQITGDLKKLDKLLEVAFRQKRKMLRSCLGKNSPALLAIEKAEIDPTRRAETLTIQEFKKWFELF